MTTLSRKEQRSLQAVARDLVDSYERLTEIAKRHPDFAYITGQCVNLGISVKVALDALGIEQQGR